MYEKMSIEIEMLTPTYLGGAYHQPEVRGASIKGLLRFWFRALYPDSHEKEGRFFGDSGTYGISPFKIRIKNTSKYRICYIGRKPESAPHQSCISGKSVIHGIKYLTFPYQLRGTERYSLAPGQRIFFEHIISQRVKNSNQWGNFKLALTTAWWGLAVFGGIGARSRRGFGSFMITNLQSSWKHSKLLSVISEKKEVKIWWEGFVKSYKKIRDRLGISHSDQYLSITPGTRIALVGNNKRGFKNWELALDYFGAELKRFRSGSTRGANLLPEEKASFGLPIVSRFLTVEGEKHTRGASPLLVSVIRIGGEYYLLVTLTHSPVLPRGERLIIKERRSMRKSTIKLGAVEEFFDEIANHSIKEMTVS